ncbi:hypothetical protein ACJMK2_034012 [Sinanodonta woodiana]|uniref:F-box protein n=1 Tax=Sinanodonta woodiana TaxID=1069815 RepID=A0ABD3WQ93_SINWO
MEATATPFLKDIGEILLVADDDETSLEIGDIPSVAVEVILSYLSWGEKLNVVLAIPHWRSHLQSSVAWPLVRYSGESSENLYFAKEERTKLLVCLKKYGKYIKQFDVSFGFKIGRLGIQILHAVAENCSSLQRFKISQEALYRAFGDAIWKRSVVQAVCAILTNCSNLNDVWIGSPLIDWSDSIENNIVMGILNSGMAQKITGLELTTNSLLEHENNLNLLTDFSRLRFLVIRREKVNNAILLALVRQSLHEVTLYQDEELPLAEAKELGVEFWKQVLTVCPQFKVNLVLKYIIVIKDTFPPNMPLKCLVLDDLANIVTKGVMDHLTENFNHVLESFTYTNSFLENFESGDKRLPYALVDMVKKCKNLHTVQYGFPLSSTSVLLMAHTRKLSTLVIPSVEVSYEFDWPLDKEWSPDFVHWLKDNGSDEKTLEQAVSQLLGFKWELIYETLSLDKDIGYL